MADESEKVAAAQAGVTPQRPTPPPLTGAAVQAAAEYQQIRGELAVGSTSVVLRGLQDPCAAGFWCLPDVNCSARDFTDAVRDAFDDNRQTCISGIGVGLSLLR